MSLAVPRDPTDPRAHIRRSAVAGECSIQMLTILGPGAGLDRPALVAGTSDAIVQVIGCRC